MQKEAFKRGGVFMREPSTCFNKDGSKKKSYAYYNMAAQRARKIQDREVLLLRPYKCPKGCGFHIGRTQKLYSVWKRNRDSSRQWERLVGQLIGAMRETILPRRIK